ncbi:MAG: hypothetical protein EB166_05005, partial [Thaumarchaeota archaeon]|nr:hypothetical protein [Nitrososphaerota archaeon]
MAKWHTIPAKFTSEEKQVLDIIRDIYGLNYNQTLRKSVELLSRIIAASEYYGTVDSPIMNKVKRIIGKHMKLADAEIVEMLKEFPKEQQDAEYKRITEGHITVLAHFDDIFVKNRKKGRRKLSKKRGR